MNRTRVIAAEAQADALTVPPIDITVRVWFDREPELFNPDGLASYIAQAALYRAAEYLDDAVGEEEEE